MKHVTIQQFFKQFPSDEACLRHLMEVRYGLEHKCRKCDRDSKFSRVSSQRAYACQFCGDHLYPCVGTLFEESRTSLQLWFYAIYLFASTRHGVSAKELQRQLGVTYKCAWRMGHEIRKHMATVDGEDDLSGIVEIDETMMGGVGTGHGRGATNKTIIFGMLERGGDLITKVVPNIKRMSLYPHIDAHIAEGSEIHSDELRSYESLGWGWRGYTHKTIKHRYGEYVSRDGTTHVNSLEGYWRLLQKGIAGTHVHVSGKHLEKYTKEFEYRYNSRQNPSLMVSELLSVFPKTSK